MSEQVQSYPNHAKIVTGYHRVLTGLLLAVLVWALVRVVTDFNIDRLFVLILVVCVITTAGYARVFPLGVQDRVIRLEERMRLERLLPDDLRARIGELTTKQLIALRFASDRELPELTRRVLDQGLADPKAIKQAIGEWRADHQRI